MLRLWKELRLLVSRQQGSGPGKSDSECSNAATVSAAKPTDAATLLYSGAPIDNDSMLLLLEPNARGAWRLKRHLKLHLYISDPPCGDASIYEHPDCTLAPQAATPCRRYGRKSPPAPPAATPPPKDPQVIPVVKRACREGVDSSVAGGVCPATATGAAGENTEKMCSADSGGSCSGRQGGQEAASVSRGDEREQMDRVKRHRCAGPSDAGLLRSSSSCPSPSPCLSSDPSMEGRKHRESKDEGLLSSETLGKGGCSRVGAAEGRAERMKFTGAKIIGAAKERGVSSGEAGAVEGGSGGGARDTVLRIVREQDQALGALRIKSSRSNISEEGRTMSLSCSDKLAKWAVLGLQVGRPVLRVAHIFCCCFRRENVPGALTVDLTRVGVGCQFRGRYSTDTFVVWVRTRRLAIVRTCVSQTCSGFTLNRHTHAQRASCLKYYR